MQINISRHTQIAFLSHWEGSIMPNPAQRVKTCASNVRLDNKSGSLHLLLVLHPKNLLKAVL